MKKTVLVFMILVTMLTGCNKVETSSNETINETNMSETTEISEEALDRTPFEVLIDKPSLESGKEKETTVSIVTDIEDWDYTVSSENGKISNKEENSLSMQFLKMKVKGRIQLQYNYQIMKMEDHTNIRYLLFLLIVFRNKIQAPC